jgi:hypothetical protein
MLNLGNLISSSIHRIFSLGISLSSGPSNGALHNSLRGNLEELTECQVLGITPLPKDNEFCQQCFNTLVSKIKISGPIRLPEQYIVVYTNQSQQSIADL